MFRLCKLAIIAVFFSSCALVTFEELSVSTNVPGQRGYLNEEYLCLDFSIAPDHKSVESQLTLTCGTQTVSYSPVWEGKRLYIKADPSWKKGKLYKVVLDGNLHMDDGRYYTHSLTEIFYYGEKNMNLVVDSYTPVFDSVIGESEKLHFAFNKPININSFQENFTLSPYCTTSMIFAADKKAVDIQAADGWGINTIYTWRIPELLADDGYSLEAAIDGRFTTSVYTDLPQIEKICPADETGPGVYNFLSPGIDKQLQQGGFLLGIVFTKPMDRLSVESAVSITPAVKGYLQQDPADYKRFVYIPGEFYDVGVQYKLTIAASARDTSGLSLQSARTEFFEPLNGYLTLSTLTANGASIDFSDADAIRDCTVDFLPPYASDGYIEFEFDFSTEIKASERVKAVNNIKVEVLFPTTSKIPTLIGAEWNGSHSAVTLKYKNFTPSSSDSSFYRATVTGGKNGVVDGRGGYLKGDICVNFKML